MKNFTIYIKESQIDLILHPCKCKYLISFKYKILILRVFNNCWLTLYSLRSYLAVCFFFFYPKNTKSIKAYKLEQMLKIFAKLFLLIAFFAFSIAFENFLLTHFKYKIFGILKNKVLFIYLKFGKEASDFQVLFFNFPEKILFTILQNRVLFFCIYY